MVVYDSASIYIEGAADLRDRIARMEAIINALMTTAIKAVEQGDISEYMLDDGQTKIKAVYKDPDQITAAIIGFERIKQIYINRLNGRGIRLVDSKNFTGRC